MMRKNGLIWLPLAAVLISACGGRPVEKASASSDQAPARSAVPSDAPSADRDLLGEIELAKAEDPSFDSVAAYLPAMRRPREAVGVKHHADEIGVAPDASLELSEDASVAENPKAWFEVGEPAVALGAGPAGCRKSLVEGVPIVAAESERAGVIYRQTVFGWSEGLSAEAPLWAYVEFQAEGRDPAARRARVSLRLGPGNATAVVRTWDLELSGRVPAVIRIKIPFDKPGQGWTEIAAAELDRRRSEVLAFWKADLGSGMGLVTPEARVNAARGAWLAFASLAVDKNGPILEPHDGSGFYEQIYGYSAALYAHALDLWGRPDEARRVLDSLLTLQAPNGLFTSHFGTPDTGTLLFALSEHFALTGDAAWLKGVAPNVVRMKEWIAAKRRESMTPGDGPRPVTYGLIKFRPYCDFGQETYDYFGDTYCASGLEKAAKALAAAGLAAEAERLAAESEAYRADILASMDKAVFESGGLKVLPLEPATHRILNDSKGRASDYYNLIASCMLESEFLPAADVRTGWVMRFIEERGGLRLGLSEFNGGVDHAYTYGYWLNCLKLDRVKPVILGFYGSLAYGMSRDTYAGVEVTHLFSGDNEPTLPHLYSCTQQLRLLRMMLVQEDGDRLWIGRALPRPWLGGEAATVVKDAPTAFGPVSFTIQPRPAQGMTGVEILVPGRRPPAAIMLRLRDPKMRPIRGVKVNGGDIRTFAGETIELPKPAGRLDIVVSYR